MSKIKAVIFDRDGVLTDYDMVAAASFFGELLPISLEEMWVRWEALGNVIGYPTSLDEEGAYFDRYWDSLADEFSLSAAEREKLHAYDYINDIVAYPDARPALEWARNNGLKVGVLSNFALASLEPSLDATGLSPLVDAACAATVIGAAKPDEDAYRIAAHALDVATEECVFFDDEAPCVEGALQVGMQAFLVDRWGDGQDIASGIISDLSAVRQIVAD